MRKESFQETELLQGDSNTVASRKGMLKLCEDLKEETRGWEHQSRDGENQEKNNTQPLPILRHDSNWTEIAH